MKKNLVVDHSLDSGTRVGSGLLLLVCFKMEPLSGMRTLGSGPFY